MAQVSNETELASALAGTDSSIQLTADISVTAVLKVQRDITLSSLSPDIYTLTKAASLSDNMFRIDSGGSLHLNSILLDGNREAHSEEDTSNRSLIRVNGGSLYLEAASVLRSNYSAAEGGGVYLQASDSFPNYLEMNGDSLITDCVSKTSGGAAAMFSGSVGDKITITGQASLTDNYAANGGGLFLRSLSASYGSFLTVEEETVIRDNHASSTGGGICFSGYRNGGGLSSLLKITDKALITANTAHHGGGIYFYSSNEEDLLDISMDAALTRNTADNNGGAICMAAVFVPARITLDNTSILENQAGTGGALYLLSDSGFALTAANCTLSQNSAVSGSSGSGGGLWLQNRSDSQEALLSFASCKLENNTASAQGGALAFFNGTSPCTFTMEGCQVTGNNASSHGGGLLLGMNGNGQLQLTESSFTGNEAGSSGGAVYYSNGSGVGTISANSVSFTGNQAGYEGGALRIASGSGTLSTTLDDCQITGNTALNNSGGGIWIGGADNNLSLVNQTLTADNTARIGNGGGIYSNTENGSLTLDGTAEIRGNQAGTEESDFGGHGGGICAVPCHITLDAGSSIHDNKALQYGGGISLAENSVLDVNGARILSNSAGKQGGGIWNHGGSTVHMEAGDISLNTAAVGGGLYNDIGSQVYMTQAAAFGLTGFNTASSHAPGVYNNGEFYTKGQRDISNGFYIEDRDAVVFLEGALTSGSILQLDNSGYVSPNPEGNPIVVGEGTADYPILTDSDAQAFRKPLQDFDGWEVRLSDDRTQIWLVPTLYTIQYENLEGSSHTNPESYTVTTPDIHLTPPAPRPGYRFTGWYDSPVNGRKVTVIPQGSTGDWILYARWAPDRPKKPRLPNRICRPGDPPCCASRQTGRRTFASLPAYPFGSPPAETGKQGPPEILFSEKPCCFFFPYICHSAVSAPTAWCCAALPGFLHSDRRVRYQIRSCSRSGLPVPDGKPPWRKPRGQKR